MVKEILSDTLRKNKTLLLHEAEKINDFMRLLMKYRNTRSTWTRDEKRTLRTHLWHLSSYIPALVIFCLPFGSLLFPLLAEVLDRRRKKRLSVEHIPHTNNTVSSSEE